MNQAAVPHGPGPKSTPTFAGGRLFTLGMSGIVTAVDAATGRQIWQKPAPPVGPLYGTAISPLVDRGLVIVHVGGHDQGALTAFDAATGEVRWSWDGDGPSYSSPLVAELDGIRQVIAMTQENIVGVEAETGTLLWRRPFTTGFTQNIITPIITGRTVIVSGFQRPVSAFRVVSREGRWSTEDAWENADASLYMTNGVLVGNALFGLSQRNSGQYFLIDVTSGRTLWTGMPRQAENAAIVRAGDLLFVLEDDAELIVGRVRPEGFEPLKRYTVAEGATWAQPVVSGRRIFVKDASTLALWTLD
jgi:outer membrane protein assembly factor BamB